MTKFIQLLSAILPFEEAVLPIFIHNAQSQKVTGIIMVGESIAASVATEITAASLASAKAQPAPAAAATTAN
jgi:hypothetical protein